MANLTAAIDWDLTLVDKNQDWLPGAQEALRAILTRGHRIIIHSARANHPGGIKHIEERLGALAQRVTIAPKPQADIYIGDNYHRFQDWSESLTYLRHLAREHQ